MTEAQKALADLRSAVEGYCASITTERVSAAWARDWFLRLSDAAAKKAEEAEREPCTGEPDDIPARRDCLRAGKHVCGMAEREPVGEHEPDLPLMEAEGDLCRVCGGEELAPQHRLAIIRILRESLDRRRSRAAEVEAPSREDVVAALTAGDDYYNRLCALFAQASRAEVIQMLLPCPRCRRYHVDEGEWATRPHRTHLCSGCGLEFRPANVATVGVRSLESALQVRP